MKVFEIYLGASRVKFSIVFENNLYRAKVNDTIILESTDYESVRENVLTGMQVKIDPSTLH